MNIKNLIIILILLESISFCEEINVNDIIHSAKEKYNKKGNDVSDVTIKVSASLKGINIEAEMVWYFKGDKFRLENSMMGMASMQIYDGESFWIMSPLTGKRRILQGSLRRGKFLLKRDWWNENFSNAKITGEEKINKADCYALINESGKKTEENYYLWIDKNTLLLIKDQIKGKGADLVNIYSDYKNFEEKLLMPFKTETTTNNLFTMITVVKDVDIKSKIKDDVFDAEKIDIKENKGMMEELKKLMK